MVLITRHMVIVFMLLASLVKVATADRLEESTRLVNTLIDDIRIITDNDLSAQDIRAHTNRIIDTYFDYEKIARFTTGPYWRQISDEQKQQYLTAFREVLLAIAETQFDYFKTTEYTHQSSRLKGNKWVIVTGLVHDKIGQSEDYEVIWWINTSPNKPPVIFDINIQNVSMLITQRDENLAVVRQNGGDFNALTETLRKQSKINRQIASE